jgi:hypothetical protein
MREMSANRLKLRWVAGLAIALAAAACGGNGQTAPHSAPAPSATSVTGGASTDCNALGINPTGMREGTCTQQGTTYTIVDENHTLTLHSLTAQLNGIRSQSSLGGAASAAPNRKLLILSLVLTNRLTASRTFDASGTQQAGLILDRTVYEEDRAAERSDLASCLKRPEIPPGQALTCAVVFDVPTAAAADVGRHGSGDIYVVDFGEDLAGNASPQTIGQIRLYH